VQVAVELMGLADHNGIDGLKVLCESTLIHNVDAANVCMFFRTAHRHEVRPCVAPRMDVYAGFVCLRACARAGVCAKGGCAGTAVVGAVPLRMPHCLNPYCMRCPRRPRTP
jgi:hypothetical protein